MVRLGDFLYRVGWVISGLLLFDVPPTIFAYSGFVARLTNIDETIQIGFACTAIACLSWLAGRGMGFLLPRIGKIKRARESQVGRRRHHPGRPLIAPLAIEKVEGAPVAAGLEVRLGSF